MPRPALFRLELATYPVQRTMEPRFGDVDAMRHLNNMAIGRIYEDARVRFLSDSSVRERLAPKHAFVMAELTIQYLAEGTYPDPLIVASGVLGIGGASITLAQALFQNGRCIGTSQSVIVHVNRQEGGPRPLPDAARAALLDQRLLGVDIESRD